MRKIASLILAFALITAMCLSALPVRTYAFDLTPEQADRYFWRAYAAGLVPEGLWGDRGATRRAEFAAFAVAFYEVVTGREIAGRMAFNDTDDVNVQKMGYLGVVTGDGNGNFSPNALVSREQVAIMLARLAHAVGITLPTQTPTFADTSAISPWAIDTVGQMQAVGLMEPLSGNRFSPTTVFPRQHSVIAMLWLYEIAQYGTRRIEVWFSHQDITNERLAQMVAGGEIPANVTHLWLGGNPISDISPLAGLTNLVTLYLWSNTIIDVDPLRNLTNLRRLYLSSNSIRDISPLDGLINLTQLHLSGNPISNIAPLGNLTNLTELSLMSNNFVSMQPLSNLTNLTILSMGDNPQFNGDITPIGRLINLTELSLVCTWSDKITDYTAIGNLVNLENLFLVNASQLTDISFLSRLANLTSLNIHAADINDFTPLGQLESLTHLRLQGSEIDDAALQQIGRLTNLTSLWFWNSYISDISPLGNLTNLENLGLSENRIVDIFPLVRLANLQWLDLSNNQVSDISALARMSSLTGISLNNNQITDISVLFGMTGMSHIELIGNPLSVYQLAELRNALPNTNIGY